MVSSVGSSDPTPPPPYIPGQPFEPSTTQPVAPTIPPDGPSDPDYQKALKEYQDAMIVWEMKTAGELAGWAHNKVLYMLAACHNLSEAFMILMNMGDTQSAIVSGASLPIKLSSLLRDLLNNLQAGYNSLGGIPPAQWTQAQRAQLQKFGDDFRILSDFAQNNPGGAIDPATDSQLKDALSDLAKCFPGANLTGPGDVKLGKLAMDFDALAGAASSGPGGGAIDKQIQDALTTGMGLTGSVATAANAAVSALTKIVQAILQLAAAVNSTQNSIVKTANQSTRV